MYLSIVFSMLDNLSLGFVKQYSLYKAAIKHLLSKLLQYKLIQFENVSFQLYTFNVTLNVAIIFAIHKHISINI